MKEEGRPAAAQRSRGGKKEAQTSRKKGKRKEGLSEGSGERCCRAERMLLASFRGKTNGGKKDTIASQNPCPGFPKERGNDKENGGPPMRKKIFCGPPTIEKTTVA